VVRAVLDVVD
jgi:hypothetical protein